jgi:hypothetical protein
MRAFLPGRRIQTQSPLGARALPNKYNGPPVSLDNERLSNHSPAIPKMGRLRRSEGGLVAIDLAETLVADAEVVSHLVQDDVPDLAA